MKTKIDVGVFRVSPVDGVTLSDRSTRVKSFCKSKKDYKKLLKEYVEVLTELQRLHTTRPNATPSCWFFRAWMARERTARSAMSCPGSTSVALFCFQVKMRIGAFAAALGGLDTLVFTGSIGENAPQVRERICAGLGFLGIELDPQRNANHAPLISSDAANVKVRVIRTDDELIIAMSVVRVLKFTYGNPTP